MTVNDCRGTELGNLISRYPYKKIIDKIIQVLKYGPVAIAQKVTVLQIQAHQVFHLKQVGYKNRIDRCIIAQNLFWSHWVEVSLDLQLFLLKHKDFPVNSIELIWTNKKIFWKNNTQRTWHFFSSPLCCFPADFHISFPFNQHRVGEDFLQKDLLFIPHWNKHLRQVTLETSLFADHGGSLDNQLKHKTQTEIQLQIIVFLLELMKIDSSIPLPQLSTQCLWNDLGKTFYLSAGCLASTAWLSPKAWPIFAVPE